MRKRTMWTKLDRELVDEYLPNGPSTDLPKLRGLCDRIRLDIEAQIEEGRKIQAAARAREAAEGKR